MKARFLLLISIAVLASACARQPISKYPAPGTDTIHEDPVEHMNAPGKWVDAVFESLSPRERIAQLFMVAGYSNKGPSHADSLERLVREYGIGGVVWFQGGPVRQTEIANRLQAATKVPLLYAMDAEWGVGMRLDSTMSYPYQMSLGALPSDSLILEMGKLIAKDFRRLGMHVNFAPVADVNNNPANPVISYRSFGEDRHNVALKATAYAKGLQSGRILTSGKHFPGHGDTAVDSHYALPLIPHDRNRLDSLELYPFRHMLDNGLSGMMIAHMSIPALDATPNLPSTLSEPIVTGILRNEYGFRGLIFTDAMNMKGVTDYFPTGEAEIRALLAGNDVLELTADIPSAIKAIEEAVKQGRISAAYIDQKVKKVLAAKQWAGLDRQNPVSLSNLKQDVIPQEGVVLNQKLAEQFVTVARHDKAFPYSGTQRTAILSVGYAEASPFQKTLGTSFDHFWLAWNTSEVMTGAVSEALKGYDNVVIALHDVRRRPLNKLNPAVWIQDLVAVQSALPGRAVVFFSNPYTWLEFESAENFKNILFAYENSDYAQHAAAHILSGKQPAHGRLPVSLSPTLTYGTGVSGQ